MGYRLGVCASLAFKNQSSHSRAWTARLNNAFTVSKLLLLVLVMGLVVQGQNISTIAGGGPPNGVKATTAPIGLPWGVVQDSAGNTYISDTFSNRVFKVDTSGNFSVIAGTGLNNEGPDGVLATSSALSSPEGLALDASGNANTSGALYIADTGNNMIRVVNTKTSGDITLFSGTGAIIVVHPLNIAVVAGTGSSCTTAPTCGDGSLATAAQLTAPGSVAVDSAGNLLIADTGDSVIREVLINTGLVGTIQLVAGNYTACSASPCGDGSSPTSAEINLPGGVLVDAAGDFMIADTGDSAIRVVNNSGAASFFGVAIATGKIGTVAGTLLTPCITAPLCGDTGSATSAKLNNPTGLSYDGSNLWIADTGNAVVSGKPVQQPALREVSSSGTMSLAAGDYTSCSTSPCGDGGLPLLAQLTGPTGVFVDTAGDVLIADQQDDAIREVSKASGNISTFAGVIFNEAYYGNGASGTTAQLNSPDSVAVDTAGNVYIADASNNVIRKVDTKGNISTVAGNGTSCAPPNFPCGDGAAATTAQLNGPQGVFVDGGGNIFIADTGDNVIREVVAATGKIQAVVGTEVRLPCSPSGKAPECGDGGPASAAQLGFPAAIFVDQPGNIYIADTNDNVIRVVNKQSTAIKVANVSIPAGDIETVAGDAATYGACTKAPCSDGGTATSAQLNSPEALFVDSTGDIFISDNGDNVIRKVDGKAGTISNVAGDYTSCSTPPCGDGGKATSAQFKGALGLWVDALGNIFVADAGRSSIRAVNTTAASVTIAGTTIAASDIDRVVATGVPGFSGDGGPASSAQLDRPHGIGGDAAGDLLITDIAAQRVRKVSTLLATAATASLSTASLTFASQDVGTTSAAQSVTVTNHANITSLTATVAISGTDAGDFKQGNNCASVVAGSSCTITVTFTPTASGTRTATVTITDNAAGSPQTVTLTGTALAASFTLPKTGTLSPSSVSAGSSATATITVTSVNNFSAAVTLTCSVSPSPTNAPGCQFSASSIKPQGGGTATSTLTVATTPAPHAALTPATKHPSIFYATWLLLPAMLLSTAGMSGSQKKKTISGVLLTLAIAGCIFLVACGGGSSSNNGGGGGGGGTPAGTYTITVTAASTGVSSQTETLTLTVQ